MAISWQAIGIGVSILVFFGGILVAVIQGLLKANQSHVDRRFSSLEKSMESRMDTILTVQNELKDFKVRVAQEYVHREDFVRVEGAREVKLDRINEKINELTALLHERRTAS